jgi:hypothetical protein
VNATPAEVREALLEATRGEPACVRLAENGLIVEVMSIPRIEVRAWDDRASGHWKAEVWVGSRSSLQEWAYSAPLTDGPWTDRGACDVEMVVEWLRVACDARPGGREDEL